MTPRDTGEDESVLRAPEWQIDVPAILASENETAARIVRTATDLFAAHGYAGTSLQDISEAADASKGSIFHYIKSKSDLLRSVVVEHCRAHRTAIDQINARHTTPGLERIAEFISLYLDYLLVADSPRTLIVDREWRELAPDEQKEILGIIETERVYLRDQIEVARERGEVNVSGPAGVMAAAIMGMLSWSHNWYRPSEGLDVTAMTRAMVDLVMYGLIARSPA
jgi:TetR/AcrR family transcriptional regulator, cholesterol catabolism regulator